MSDRFRCAAHSRAVDEPVHATASRVRRWLVVEQPGPWGRNAIVESRLDPEIGLRLQEAGRRHGVRIVLMRRPGWRDDHVDRRRVYAAHTGHRSSWLERFDLDDAAQLLDLDLQAIASREPPGLGAPGPESVHLVCTNGRHDACCADFGRPVVRALAAASHPEVWECSHIGGDRFAANIVCLPTGVYFGRVEPDDAVGMLADFATGLLDLDHYRGRSCYSPLAQAAELFLRRELGEARLDGVVLDEAHRDGDDRIVARFTHDGGAAVVVVDRERAPGMQLTCSAAGPAEPWRYRLVSITAEP